MKVQKVISSALATLMTLNLVLLAFALWPGHYTAPASTRAESGAEVHEAGLFGCIWACLKCVGTAGTNGRACRRCARCLGDDDAGSTAHAR